MHPAKEQSLIQGSILKSLIPFAFPVLLALFLQAMYGAADLIIVGQFANTYEQSSVASGSQLFNMVTMAITGLTMGVTVYVGNAIGAREPEKAGHGAVFAQVFLPEIGQLLLVVHGGTVGFELCAQGADLFFHCAPSFCFLPVAGTKRQAAKKAPSLKRSGTKPCKQTSSAVPPVFRRKSGGAQDCRNGAGPVPHYCAGKKAFPAGRSGANFRAGTPGAAFSR